MPMQRIKMILTLAAVFGAASVAGLRAKAQAAAPVQVPAAPAAGIDSSKMPDAIGIHLGMSPQEVLAIMKPHFPEDHTRGLGLTPGFAKFGHAPDQPWLQTIGGKLDPCGNNECAEIVSIIFNGPPNKQGAVSIERSLSFQQGKQPTVDTLKDALVQKYGANVFVVAAPGTLGWIYDEQGQSLMPANGKALARCAGNISTGAIGGPSPANSALEYGITGTQTLKLADVTQMMRDPCRVGVYVLADLNAAGGIVRSLDLKITENSESTRDAIAEQQYLDRVATGQQQQQLDNAQHQAVPKF